MTTVEPRADFPPPSAASLSPDAKPEGRKRKADDAASPSVGDEKQSLRNKPQPPPSAPPARPPSPPQRPPQAPQQQPGELVGFLERCLERAHVDARQSAQINQELVQSNSSLRQCRDELSKSKDKLGFCEDQLRQLQQDSKEQCDALQQRASDMTTAYEEMRLQWQGQSANAQRLQAEVLRLQVQLDHTRGRNLAGMTVHELNALHQSLRQTQDVVMEHLFQKKKEATDEENLTCVVCNEARKAVAFDPCGHVATCANCSPPLLICPLCRAVIKTRLPVFL